MRSTFWPNRIFERQSSQNRHLGLKFSSKRENSALSPWKLYKTLLSGHAQHVLAKSHFWASKFSKSSHGPEILSKTRKQCAFHENFTRRSGLKLELRTFARTENTYETLKGRYQVNLQEKINHNQNFSQFSETEAINLKKVASFFQDAIHFHRGHLQPKTLIFTIRALVE